ncbi:MAG: endonuclease III [Candidatus Caldatribacterium sp.]|uniref:endonuclease III n=1 Tax=Candidatus Caldatribacterium sp. TaxID=2282143 RepID=UPI00299A267B|nr:endonuclease III [Candidatus Caldatribacterium sp.]MCX7731528.1 endonuclease III [Candidatus Caldatribacterium sp.]MDW8081861.1 endonuclease III [Candidatus Calescibacterium sp.]
MEERITVILDRLKERFPDARLLLAFRNPFELLVATILAAQARDEKVNEVTQELFARFPTPEALAQAPPEEIAVIVKPLNYAKKKAAFIQKVSEALVTKFGGKVPTSLEDLVTLPGVGRKTANVVLANAYAIPAIPVDTHVGRVAGRIGLSQAKTPEEVEEDLMELIPKDRWIEASHLFGFLGRFICEAKKPRCTVCPILDLCAYPGKPLSPVPPKP